MLKNFIQTYLQNRSGKVLFNIICSMFAKGGALLISFFLVPLTIDYLSPAEYGVWMTLSSMVAWVIYFDVGLGNGLRNKLTEALSVRDLKLAREYVSTCYLAILLIGIVLVGGLWIANHFLSWNRILNIAEGRIPGCNQFVFLIFAFFAFTFVLRTTGVVFTAYQYPMLNDVIQLCINILIISGILLLKHTISPGGIKSVGYVYILIPFVIWLFVYPLAFCGKLREVRPGVHCFRKRHLNSLMVLGGKFFMLQMACLILLSSVNLILAHLCGNEAVTQYNVVLKYFTVLILFFGIMLGPYWNAITEAFTKKDLPWIRKQIKFLILIWSAFSVVNIIMVLCSSNFFLIWVGDKIHIPLSLVIAVAFYTAIVTWGNIFAFLVNGISCIKISVFSTAGAVVLFFPLCYFLSSLWGASGIVWGINNALLLPNSLLTIQGFKILHGTARGIWLA